MYTVGSTNHQKDHWWRISLYLFVWILFIFFSITTLLYIFVYSNFVENPCYPSVNWLFQRALFALLHPSSLFKYIVVSLFWCLGNFLWFSNSSWYFSLLGKPNLVQMSNLGVRKTLWDFNIQPHHRTVNETCSMFWVTPPSQITKPKEKRYSVDLVVQILCMWTWYFALQLN